MLSSSDNMDLKTQHFKPGNMPHSIIPYLKNRYNYIFGFIKQREHFLVKDNV